MKLAIVTTLSIFLLAGCVHPHMGKGKGKGKRQKANYIEAVSVASDRTSQVPSLTSP